jgi:hypothetical protein
MTKVVFHESGYLSNDSTNYLFLAQNVLNGHGFYTHSETAGDGVRVLFSSWPVGYSTLIAVISGALNISVFIASKILNLIFIGLIFFIFRAMSPFNAWVYSLIFFFSSYLEIFSFTWSETGFIFGLTAFSYYLYKHLNEKTNHSYDTAMLILSICFLFVMRYVGAFTIGVLGLLWLYLLIWDRAKKKLIIIISIIIAINITFVASYLGFNFIETGLLTGRERVLAPESNYDLLITLLKTLLAEISILVYHPRPTFIIPALFLQIFLCSYYYFKHKSEFIFTPAPREQFPAYKIFFIVGILYISSIVVIRWNFYFNEYSFRLLGPGTFLLYVSLVSFIEVRLKKISFSRFVNIFVILTVVSFILYVPTKTYLRFTQPYSQTLELLNQKYNIIPYSSVLAFEKNKHLKYVRSDLIIKKPLFTESVEEFYNRVNSNKDRKVFVENSDLKNIKKYDVSFQNLLSQQPLLKFIEILK